MNRFRHALLCAGLLVLAAVLTVAATLPAGLSYTTRTSIEMSGLAGRLMQRAGMGETVEEHVFTASRMATRTEDARTIVDLDAETITTVDDKRRTYTVMTFEQLMAFARGASEGMAEAADEAEMPEPDDDAPEVRAELDFWVDDTGVRERVNGHDAELFRIHVVADIQAEQEEGGEMEDAGQFALAMELWMADVDGYDHVQAFQRAYAEAMGRALTGQDGMMEAIGQMLGQNPAIEDAMARSREEMARMEGMAVREVTHVVTVPPGMTYDPDKVFAQDPPEEKKKKRGLGRLARRMAEQAAGVQGEEDDAERPTEQKTRMTSTTDYENFRTGDVDESAFAVPSDYTLVQPEAER